MDVVDASLASMNIVEALVNDQPNRLPPVFMMCVLMFDLSVFVWIVEMMKVIPLFTFKKVNNTTTLVMEKMNECVAENGHLPRTVLLYEVFVETIVAPTLTPTE
jgi:hypothetical protein